MHTRNVNVKTAAQESSRKMGGKTVSYTILVAETKKNSEEEPPLKNLPEDVIQTSPRPSSWICFAGSWQHLKGNHNRQFLRRLRMPLS